MSKVEEGGPIDPPPLKASCNYFFFEASRVNNTNSFFYSHSTFSDVVTTICEAEVT